MTRENYRECLRSVASQEDSSEFYGDIMVEGIIQTLTDDGSLCYMIADDIDPEAPIHGLTRLQQEHYCS